MVKEIYVISKNWSRHGDFSGYEKVIKYYKNPIKIIKGFSLPYKIVTYFKKNTKIENYRSENFTKELSIFLIFYRKKIIQVLYGDMDYYYLSFLKNSLSKFLNNEVVVTFHHPPYELEKRLNYNRKKVLGSIDKIIVMGPNQIPFIEPYTDAKIKFIPHGIDTDYFRMPVKQNNRNNEIFIIGISHRDHERNIKIIKAVHHLNENINFLVVMNEEYAKLYKKIPNVKIVTDNISDEYLLNCYHTSRGILLSLVDCTASNTILEALATGCPLITNNVGAVKDYIPETSGIHVFESEEIEESAKFILKLFEDENFYSDVARKQRDLALQYNWKNIAKITEAFILND